MARKFFKFKLVMAIPIILMLRNMKRLRSAQGIAGRHLLLIAHPDDESMFFAPSLLNLKGKFDVVCLSNGNKEGKGRIREEEFQKVAKYLGAKLIIFPTFEDGEDWSSRDICIHLMSIYALRPFEVLMTFDERGVSGHKNHISCHKGAKLFLKGRKDVKGMFLDSKNLFYKYVFDLSNSNVSYVTPFGMLAPARMILLHRSQIRWFSYLYIFFSNFLTYNDFRTVN